VIFIFSPWLTVTTFLCHTWQRICSVCGDQTLKRVPWWVPLVYHSCWFWIIANRFFQIYLLKVFFCFSDIILHVITKRQPCNSIGNDWMNWLNGNYFNIYTFACPVSWISTFSTKKYIFSRSLDSPFVFIIWFRPPFIPILCMPHTNKSTVNADCLVIN
jgi:hypothetical protein